MFGSRANNTSDDTARPLEVLIAGGAVAALEAALGLHRLGGDRVHTTLVAPRDEFIYRPMTVVFDLTVFSKPSSVVPLAREQHQHDGLLVQ